jgi:2-polyprenyl-6-methoxyphenol hydroxylase-like FAD-dependent oxidoreductase
MKNTTDVSLVGISPLKILICGGGIAGPALAYWLARAGHEVMVVERFPALRASGAQIDLRGQGIEAIKRMGLYDAIRSKRVDEPGTSFVNSKGKVIGTMMANTSGQGAQSFTSEYEMMRGDLVRILYDTTKEHVKYLFGITVEHFEQDEKQVIAFFSDGSSDTFDLLVGADGQGSSTREAILSSDTPDPYLHLGIAMAYFFIPRIETDTNFRYTYNSPGGRMVMRRSHTPTETQVYFVLRDDEKEASALFRASPDEQKEFWTQRFRGAGWQTERFLKGMQTAEDFYSQEVVQVRVDTWSKGRVVLLGDAAYCPSPFSGMGTSVALMGAYVLAGEINRHADNLPQAFANYDKIMRPVIDEVQDVNPFLLRLGIPRSRFGVGMLLSIGRLASFLHVAELMARFSKDDRDGGWKLPEYPELKLKQ